MNDPKRPVVWALEASPTHAQIAGEMAERLRDVVYSYADRVPLALAVGVVSIVEHELIAAAREADA